MAIGLAEGYFWNYLLPVAKYIRVPRPSTDDGTAGAYTCTASKIGSSDDTGDNTPDKSNTVYAPFLIIVPREINWWDPSSPIDTFLKDKELKYEDDVVMKGHFRGVKIENTAAFTRHKTVTHIVVENTTKQKEIITIDVPTTITSIIIQIKNETVLNEEDRESFKKK